VIYYVKGIKEKLYNAYIANNGNLKAEGEAKRFIIDKLKKSFFLKHHYLPIECRNKIYIVIVKIENLETLLGAG